MWVIIYYIHYRLNYIEFVCRLKSLDRNFESLGCFSSPAVNIMNIIEHSHTRNHLTGSILLNVVLKIDHNLFVDTHDDYMPLKEEISKFLSDLKTKLSLIKLENYSSAAVNIDKAIIVLFSEDCLSSEEFFILNAK